MPGPLPISAATGGVSAALVSALLRSEAPLIPHCQDLFDRDRESALHWPSLVLGILAGLFLAQVLDAVVILRQLAHGYLRQRGWALQKAVVVRDRLG